MFFVSKLPKGQNEKGDKIILHLLLHKRKHIPLQEKQSSPLYLVLIEFLTRGSIMDFCDESALDNITIANSGRFKGHLLQSLESFSEVEGTHQSQFCEGLRMQLPMNLFYPRI